MIPFPSDRNYDNVLMLIVYRQTDNYDYFIFGEIFDFTRMVKKIAAIGSPISYWQ